MEEKIYPDERLGTVLKDGLPDFNELVLHFLRQSGTSVEQFGRLYGQAVKSRPYTKARLYQMIQDKSFPTDPKRRWVIAKLLQIPPVLLGVNVLDDLLPDLHIEATSEKPKKIAPLDTGIKNVDLKEYRQALKNYSSLNHTNTAVSVWDDINQKIANLERMTLYGKNDKKQRLKLISLLCGYHMLLSYIARDQQWYDIAMTHCNQAYGLTNNEKLPDMQAAILQQRGCVLYSQACSYENALDLNTARSYFALAHADFQKALQLEAHLSPYPGLQGYLHVASGVVQAHMANNPSQLHEALKEVDKAERFVGQENGYDIIHLSTLDEGRYHLDRASVYINAPVTMAQYPKDSRRELRWAATQVNPNARRRQALHTILFAKSYLLEQEYSEATKKASEALLQAQEIHSHINITRIAAICKELQASDYGKSHLDVPSLEIEIVKATHPELFH